METRYRKFWVVLLMVCFISPLCLNYAFLKLRQYKIKEQVQHKLLQEVEPSELVTLRFTAEEAKEQLDWEHSREFEYKGQMYDVVSKAVKGDTIIYTVWWDKAETKIKNELKRVLAGFLQRDMSRQPFQEQLSYFYKHLQCLSIASWHLTKEGIDQVFTFQMPYLYHEKVDFSPPVPPPNSISFT